VVGHLYDKAKKVKSLWCGGEVEDSHGQSKKKRTRSYNQVQPSIADPSSLPYFYGVIFTNDLVKFMQDMIILTF
jgi:hypothetical protein